MDYFQRRRAPRIQQGRDFDVSIWIIIGGLIGARLFHILDRWADRYAADPVVALYIGGVAMGGIDWVILLVILAVVALVRCMAFYARQSFWNGR